MLTRLRTAIPRAAIRRASTSATGSGGGLTGGSGGLLLAGNAVLAAGLAYTAWAANRELAEMRKSLDFGMDRIDECLNRIDLRNNETTGYFETVSKKIEELERQEGKKKK